jgi:tRNA threonylcarbamoyl adenosine modification protein (Sua5/YciO/YrdC/YwlC family)
VSVRYDCAVAAPRGRGIGQAYQVARAGDLVVFPTDTVYGLACDAFSSRGYAALLRAKGATQAPRTGPSPVMIAHAATLTGVARGVTTEIRSLIESFWPGGLTLVVHAQSTLRWDLNPTIAVRVPLHPIALEVLDKLGPMAVLAANAPGGQPPLTCADAKDQLGEDVGVYLDGGPVGGDGRTSTVIDATGDRLRVVRVGSLSLTDLWQVAPDLLGPNGEQAHDGDVSPPGSPSESSEESPGESRDEGASA